MDLLADLPLTEDHKHRLAASQKTLDQASARLRLASNEVHGAAAAHQALQERIVAELTGRLP